MPAEGIVQIHRSGRDQLQRFGLQLSQILGPYHGGKRKGSQLRAACHLFGNPKSPTIPKID